MKLTASMIREAASGIDSFCQVEVRSYSGRGMNGRECVAVVVSDAWDLVRFGMSLAYVVAMHHEGLEDDDPDENTATDAIDTAISELPYARTDSMGRDLILYWPSIPADAETTPDLDALFTTPQIHTDDAGVHRDDAGRAYRAAMVGGETTYELAEEAQDEL